MQKSHFTEHRMDNMKPKSMTRYFPDNVPFTHMDTLTCCLKTSPKIKCIPLIPNIFSVTIHKTQDVNLIVITHVHFYPQSLGFLKCSIFAFETSLESLRHIYEIKAF